jgi:hypothetical protein
MPSRHIPPYAFDDILSDLGDDPAIPDPHGIRKTNPLKNDPPEPSNKPSIRQKFEGLPDPLNTPLQLKKLGGLLAIFACFIGLAVALFAVYESLKTHSQTSTEDVQKHLLDLKKDIEILRGELESSQDDIYKEIDLMEVSIHLLKENKAQKRFSDKPRAIPHESELGRWRYLGNSQIGESHRGFFNTGKGISTFEKGAQVMGEWRLNHITKDGATLSHPQGKTLVLNASKSE